MVAPGARFGVYEIVEPLGARLAANPAGLPLDEAVSVARQIADARQAAAHDKGVKEPIADPCATQPETTFVVVVNYIAELNGRRHPR